MIELQLGGGVRPVVRQHGIGAPHKRVAHLDPFRLFQVDADAAFPAIEGYEHPAFIRHESSCATATGRRSGARSL